MEKERTTIQVGDYIVGTEQWGREAIPEYGIESTLRQHEMRGWVDSIFTDKNTGNKSYNIKADDTWGGARGGTICEELGPVEKLEESEIVPYWWDKGVKKNEVRSLHRDWKAFDLVKHFKGTLYRIIGVGKDTETEQEVIIYKRADNTGEVWVRPRAIFEGEVDHEKYPEVKQEWRFEKIEG